MGNMITSTRSKEQINLTISCPTASKISQNCLTKPVSIIQTLKNQLPFASNVSEHRANAASKTM